MKWIRFSLLLFLSPSLSLRAQHVFRAIVRDSLTGEALAGVTALFWHTSLGAASDASGKLEIRNIPSGKDTIRFSFVGYGEKTISLVFPHENADTVFIVPLAPSESELGEVTISATRTNSRIEDLPTRIEVLGADDLNEENGIKPSGIASLLSDIAGVQLQQTSATTGNAQVRIQGLDGKYTQMLYDGMPLFGGFSGSLGVLQIPPLDLKQIEIIKGASSTLHGGGAIAGLVNLVSKTPVEGKPERTITINQTSLLETDANLYFSGRNRRAGYSFFGGGMFQQYRDVDMDGFTDLPRLWNVFIHPTLFLYARKGGMIRAGLNSNYLDQRGGDMDVMHDRPDSVHRFYVANRSIRNTVSVSYLPRRNASGVSATACLSQFYRDVRTDRFRMEANQFSLFSEVSCLKVFTHDKLVAGLNLKGEFFSVIRGDSIHFGNTDEMIPGLFIQNEWTASKAFTLEAGFRADYNTRYGWFLLPRLNALFNVAEGLKTRIGGGLGYGTPTNFLNSFQEQEYPFIMPLPAGIKAERSAGANWDINYDHVFSGNLNMTLNQSFFYTYISGPVISSTFHGDSIVFSNASKPVTTLGSESYLRIKFFRQVEVYLGYVFTDARKEYDTVSTVMSLNARHKASAVITWEPGEHWMAGLESSYIGRQYTDDHQGHPEYFLVALMVSFRTGPWRFVLNGENLLDYRQSGSETVVLPPVSDPVFKQLWAPTDGRVINFSVTLSL